MKILHTADVHLDSPLTGVAQGNVRRRELLKAFLEMAKYCDNNGIGAVIVAGDLFDDKFTMPITVETVAQIINNSAAQWYLLQGNHGNAEPYRMLEKRCENVHLFGRQWTAYQLDGVCIVGRELGDNDAEYWRTFSPPANCYTVLTLHGDVANADYGLIDKRLLRQVASTTSLWDTATLLKFSNGAEPSPVTAACRKYVASTKLPAVLWFWIPRPTPTSLFHVTYDVWKTSKWICLPHKISWTSKDLFWTALEGSMSTTT